MRRALAKNAKTTALVVAMTLAFSHTACVAQEVAPSHLAVAAHEAIESEVRAFYRDLGTRDWATLLTHFWPAKITARWEPPMGSGSWTHRSAGTLPDAGGSGSASGRRADACSRDGALRPRTDVRVEGRWAQVMATRCAANADELWLLDVNGRWKIVRLVLGS